MSGLPFLNALASHARHRPGQIALQNGLQRMSYADLWQRVEALANELHSAAVHRLALQVDNSPEWVLVDLACVHADIVLVPIPGFFSDRQVTHSLADSGCDAVLRDSAAGTSTTRRLRTLPGMGLERLAVAPGDVPGLPAHTAKITYTSGSTGSPKGVCLSVSNQLLTATAVNQRLEHVALPLHLAVLPLATLLENVAGVYAALLRGATVVLPSLHELGWQGSSGLEVAKLCGALEKYRPSSAIILPQLLRGLNEIMASGNWSPPDSLTFVAVGGARCAATDILSARRRGLPVYEGYGLSESASVVSLNAPGADRPGSAGRLLGHCQSRLLDGHLAVRGNTFLGYLGGASSLGGGWLDTGDLASRDADGYLWLDGRSKNVLVSSFGRNISPEWPESELLSCREILQCLVFGDARPYCGALILPAPGVADTEIEAAVKRCNARLPDYATVKAWWRLDCPFSAADGELTANGRPRREIILQHYARAVEQCYGNQGVNNVVL